MSHGNCFKISQIVKIRKVSTFKVCSLPIVNIPMKRAAVKCT